MSMWRICSTRLTKSFKTNRPLFQCLLHSSTQSRHFSRRAVMYVPSSDMRKLRKIPLLGVDTVVLDFEDGVAYNQKETARTNVAEGLKIASQSNSETIVRINGIDSGIFTQDLSAVFATDDAQFHALMLPKCDSTEHLKELDIVVGFYAGSSITGQIHLHIIIESPVALKSLMSICECGLLDLQNLKLQSVTFGSDDYLAAIGGQRTDTTEELIYARQSLVASTKAYGIQAIDIVSTDFKDLRALELEAMEGARMGFTGKQIIHPAQIDVVQRAFTPSPEQVEWATGLIKMFEEHQSIGKGAFVYRGKMIDKPLLLQAENIIKRLPQDPL